MADRSKAGGVKPDVGGHGEASTGHSAPPPPREPPRASADTALWTRGLPALESASLAALAGHLAMAELTPQGLVVKASPAYRALFGGSTDALSGKPAGLFQNPGAPDVVDLARDWGRLAQGETLKGEFRRRRPDGQDVFFHATCVPVLDEEGRVVRVIEHCHDLTAIYRSALPNVGRVSAIMRAQAVIEFDTDGSIVSANENFCTLMGYRVDELVGQHHRMFLDKGDTARQSYRTFWERLAAGEYQSGEYLRLGKDGRRVWLRATYNPIFDLDGRVTGVVKFANDVTAEKLRHVEVATRMDAVSASHCIYELGPDRRILAVNDCLLATTGQSREALLGKAESVLMCDDDIGTAQHEAGWRQLRLGEAVIGEFRRRGADHSEWWMQATQSPVMGLDGQLLKVVVIAQDITASMLGRLEVAGRMGAIDRSQAVIEFDLTGRVLTANENFLALMGYQLDEIAGRHHRMFVEPNAADSQAYAGFWDQLAHGQFMSGEFKRLGKNGREVWLQATYNPILDPNGRSTKFVKFASDITQAKLDAAEFEAKVTAIDKAQAVIEFDLDGHVLSANRNFLVAMGYTLREIRGQHHSLFCTGEYVQSPAYRDFWLRLNEGEHVTGRFHRVGKFDREVWIQATYNPVFDLNGKVTKVVKFAYDVTKEVTMEHDIARKSQQMSATITTLVDSIQNIARNSGIAADLAMETATVARTGCDALDKSISAIRSIEESSQRVAEIVGVIGEIANQTNLLAFNAAIEAARAGQHGIGFSVVAGEVRKLAERSSQAAAEIARLIDAANTQIRAGSAVNKDAASSFEGILQSVERTSGSVMAIADAAGQQRVMAEDVSKLVDQLAGSARQ